MSTKKQSPIERLAAIPGAAKRYESKRKQALANGESKPDIMQHLKQEEERRHNAIVNGTDKEYLGRVTIEEERNAFFKELGALAPGIILECRVGDAHPTIEAELAALKAAKSQTSTRPAIAPTATATPKPAPVAPKPAPAAPVTPAGEMVASLNKSAAPVARKTFDAWSPSAQMKFCKTGISPPAPITRTAFNALSNRDKSAFCLAGGKLTE